jgi:serine/threonine protein phosphatase 1
MSRIFAVGDIHGCLTAFETLLHLFQLSPDDRLVTLGDYVDRGPDSRRVLDRLILLHEIGQLIALRGNHEIMMLAAREDWKAEKYWLGYGGKEALESYAPIDRTGQLNDVPDKHWQFLVNHCLPYYETDTHVFVHAGLHPLFDLDSQPDEELYWRTWTNRGPHVSGKIVICGHTIQADGRPKDWGHTIGLDTGAFQGSWLTALNVHTNEYFQADQNGKTRSGSLLANL